MIPWRVLWLSLLCLCLAAAPLAAAPLSSTNIHLDRPIYGYLDKLAGFGLITSDIKGIKPFSKAEAARLLLEAEQNLALQSVARLHAGSDPGGCHPRQAGTQCLQDRTKRRINVMTFLTIKHA
jgi:hypothetical protein